MMASRFYTLLLIVAGAGALFSLGSMFGLGVLTAPPIDEHKELTVVAKPVKVDKKAEQARREADSKLSPLYPTSPGLTKAELRAAEQASAAAKSAPSKTDEANPPQQSATTGAPAASEPEPRDAAPAKTASVMASTSVSKPDDKPTPKQVANVSPAPATPDRGDGDNDGDLKGAIAEVRKMTPGAENLDDDPYPPGRRVIMIERW